MLKCCLKHPIEPKYLLEIAILETFEQIHRFLSHDLKDESKSGELTVSISDFRNLYW